MGTRSSVAMLTPDNKIMAISGHWDGYPSWVGHLLVNYYFTHALAQQLVDHGDFSSLGKEIGSLSQPASKDKTVFYGRDRGETNVGPRIYENEKEWFDTNLNGSEYFYLFNNGNWTCKDFTGKKISLKKFVKKV